MRYEVGVLEQRDVDRKALGFYKSEEYHFSKLDSYLSNILSNGIILCLILHCNSLVS